jgi:hypothetical protein
LPRAAVRPCNVKLHAIAAAVAACFGPPEEQIHVGFAPAGTDRMAFDGKLVD